MRTSHFKLISNLAAVITLLTVCPITASAKADRPAASGNRAFLVQDPAQAYDVRTQIIDSETEEIFADFHMWDTTGAALESLAHLCLKARSGVRIRVVSDGLSRDGLNLVADASLLKVLNEDCVSPDGNRLEIRFWNPTRGDTFGLINISHLRRSHEKVLFARSLRIAYEGDRNWQNVNFGMDPKHANSSYLSTDAVFQGEISDTVSEHLEEVWSVAVPLKLKNSRNVTTKDAALHGLGRYTDQGVARAQEDFEKALANAQKNQASFKLQKLFHRVENATYMYFDAELRHAGKDRSGLGPLSELLRSAKKDLLITTPYLRLPKETLKIITELRERDVNVQLVTSNPKSRIVNQSYAFQNRDIKRLRRLGVEIFQSVGEDPLHMKTVVVDHHDVFVGTNNFDMRAYKMDMESGFIFSDAESAQKIEAFLAGRKVPYKMRTPFTQYLYEPFAQSLLKFKVFEDQL